MRVYQFITIFLALGITCGCSHRRAQQQPVAATLCDCATCRYEQQRLINAGAVPAEHFENSSPAKTPTTAPELLTPAAESPVAAEPSELSPEYTTDSDNAVEKRSPFSSGNPINMDEAPQLFNAPVVDEVKSLPNQIPNDTLKLTPEVSSPPPIGQRPEENSFKPFSRDLFKVKSEKVPLEQQPSILIDKVTETSPPDLDAVDPKPTSQFQLSFSEPSSSDFSIPDSITAAPAVVEPELPEIVEPEIDTRKPETSTFESASNVATPDFAANTRNFTPALSQPTETVVEGQLYEDPVVLYARPRRSQLVASPVQAPRSVQPVSVQKPVEQVDHQRQVDYQRQVNHQGIAQHSQLDPVYGLPLNNQVSFNSLPAIAEPQQLQQPTPSPVEAQHLHVHIHHDYGNNAGVVQGPVAYQNGQPAANVQVVYRDDKGRVIMAPPTPTMGVAAVVPTGDPRTYYIPPKQILRLKAVSPIDQPRSNPSVANIQMRDTVVYGGNHLLTKPEYQAQAVQTNHGLPGIDHEKLREAFKTSPADRRLR